MAGYCKVKECQNAGTLHGYCDEHLDEIFDKILDIIDKNKDVPYKGFKGEPPCWNCVLDKKCKPENPCQALKDLIKIRKIINKSD